MSTLLTRRRVLALGGTAIVSGCTFRGVGPGGELIFVQNERPSAVTARIRCTDRQSGETLIDETITLPTGGAKTVPDPTDLDAATGSGAIVSVAVNEDLSRNYIWNGGAAADVQQLQITIGPHRINFALGPPTTPANESGT